MYLVSSAVAVLLHVPAETGSVVTGSIVAAGVWDKRRQQVLVFGGRQAFRVGLSGGAACNGQVRWQAGVGGRE